jgi:hypothetical protein
VRCWRSSCARRSRLRPASGGAFSVVVFAGAALTISGATRKEKACLSKICARAR